MRIFRNNIRLIKIISASIKISAFNVYCQDKKIHVFGSATALPEGKVDTNFFDEKGCDIVTFGPNFGVALDESANLYIWGVYKGDYKTPFIACKVYNVIDCQCTENDIYILKSDGTVHVIRNIKDVIHKECVNIETLPIPKTSFFESNRIKKMNVGNKHVALITENGKLFCSGNNSHGQCGMKPSITTSRSTYFVLDVEDDSGDNVILNEVKFKEGVRITNVACGGRHTICIDDKNNIYAFGDDSSVQLFLGDTRGRSLLQDQSYKRYFKFIQTKVKSRVQYDQKERHLQFNPVKINDYLPLNIKKLVESSKIHLEAGDNFSIITIEDNSRTTLLTSGDNRFGQLGSVNMETQQIIRLNNSIKSLSCGSTHCLSLMNDNRLYGWGNNRQNQLIRQKGKRIVKPEEIKLPLSGSVGKYIKYIRCAYNNSIIVTDSS